MILFSSTQRAVVSGINLPHLSRWVMAVVVLLAAAAVLRAGCMRLARGPRRPWLPFALRVRLRMRPGPGWAGRWQLWRAHGRPAARKVARRARPSLSRAARRFGSWRQYAAFLGWGQGWLWRWRVYAHLESLILMIAAPQEGKTQAAAGMVIDAPGAVVAPSIRGDLIRATAGLRAERGRVHVWDPEQAGGFGSTIRWNIVHGCADITTAVRRAGYMVEAVTGTGRAEEAFWNDQASMTLAALLHAAALANVDMRHVHAWAAGDDDTPLRILDAHVSASPAARDHLALYLSFSDRTRQSIAATLARVLKFMLLPACAEAVTTADGGPGFDFAAFVTSTDTLYLVAADSATSPVPPLFTAIIAELAHAARLAGTASRAGRLDPPLTAVLDEVANIAPVPVAEWASWAAGSGIRLVLITQSYAQLKQRWGADGAAVIWQCCKTKVIYGATTEDELCAITERACGTVRVRTTERDHRGLRRGHEEIPLLPGRHAAHAAGRAGRGHPGPRRPGHRPHRAGAPPRRLQTTAHPQQPGRAARLRPQAGTRSHAGIPRLSSARDRASEPRVS